MQYEVFRLTITGIGPVAAAATVAFRLLPTDALSDAGDLWAIALAVATSSFSGYLLNQMHRLWVTARRSRKNTTELRTEAFANRVRGAALSGGKGNSSRVVWFDDLTSKDLHRFLWVTLANSELRARSETYWERYYTNTVSAGGIVLASLVAYVVLAIVDSPTGRDTLTLLAWLTISGILWRARGEYLRISVSIENAWMEMTASFIEDDPEILGRVLKD